MAKANLQLVQTIFCIAWYFFVFRSTVQLFCAFRTRLLSFFFFLKVNSTCVRPYLLYWQPLPRSRSAADRFLYFFFFRIRPCEQFPFSDLGNQSILTVPTYTIPIVWTCGKKRFDKQTKRLVRVDKFVRSCRVLRRKFPC